MAKKPAKKEAKEVVKSADLNTLRNTINKEFGDGTIMFGPTAITNVEVFPTGIASLDIAMGCNGIPLGRIIEVYGTESGGKTTTCLQIIAGCQKHYFEKRKRNGVAAFIDAEHALDPVWAKNIGVNMGDLLLCQPSSGEEAFSVVERMVDSGLVDVIVVDSAAALTPLKIINGEIGDVVIGAQAQLMSKGLQKLSSKCGRTGCTIIFINQIRMKIGVMFGNPETTPGGRALKFYSSIRMDVRKGDTIKEKELAIGTGVKVKIVKNKVAPPFTAAEYNISFGTPHRPIYGVDMNESLITMGLHHGVLKLAGSSYKFGNVTLGNGKLNSVKFLDENPKVVSEIREKIYIAPVVLSPEPPEESDMPDSEDEESFNMVEESDG